MLRRVLGVTLLVGVLSLTPIAIDPPKPGQGPALALNNACGQSALAGEVTNCCWEFQSICLVEGTPYVNKRSIDGGPCEVTEQR